MDPQPARPARAAAPPRRRATLEIIAAAEGDAAPARHEPAQPRRPVDDGLLATPTGRILVAGTDRDAIDEVREALSPDGYHVSGVDDGEMMATGARGRVSTS